MECFAIYLKSTIVWHYSSKKQSSKKGNMCLSLSLRDYLLQWTKRKTILIIIFPVWIAYDLAAGIANDDISYCFNWLTENFNAF